MKSTQANAGASHLSDIPGLLLLAGGMLVNPNSLTLHSLTPA
ncbi:hypothetical protein [Serratia marcescens]|nr:hypothetical protein [Serratia marcescens]